MNCIFCSIIAKDVPSTNIYEDEFVYAFRDIHPQAAVHVLVVPKKHISSIDAVTPKNSEAVTKIFEAIPAIAKASGLTQGYRVVSNVGQHGCQSVKHLHFHLIGGEQLSEKMS